MDILDRLRRIEQLERANAAPAAVLSEVRELLAEAEVWVRSEARESERARAAVDALRGALQTGGESLREGERTLVA
jgi:hypothetical protein